MMESRTAEANADFFLPHLSKGMNIVDIGCGPGSITVGLAEAVNPGTATGIDIEPSQVSLARERAAEMKLPNCRFEVGSVFELPIPDNSVDAVFGHTILMQFQNPEPVLDEVKRILRPGGLVGFREIDFGASLHSSEDDAIRVVMSLLRRSILENDGNPDIGRRLPALVSQAGFEVISAKPTYACSSTAPERIGMYNVMKSLWEQAVFVAEAESAGWLTAEERSALPDRLAEEANDPGRLTGTTYVEVVGRTVA